MLVVSYDSAVASGADRVLTLVDGRLDSTGNPALCSA